jgi:uncharacterized membrane protein
MSKHRLELFSDGVMAIIITIMVLDLKTPDTGGLAGWSAAKTSIALYLLGFINVASAWVIHHDVFARFREITRPMIWANFGFLFFESLVPLSVRTIAERPTDAVSAALGCVNVALAGLAMMSVRFAALPRHRHEPGHLEWHQRRNKQAIGAVALLFAAAGLAFVSVYLALIVFLSVFVAMVARRT